MEFHRYGIFLSTFLFDMRDLGICDIYVSDCGFAIIT